MLNFFRIYCFYLACCGGGCVAMVAIMMVCPETAVEGHANICGQDNTNLNPI
jgi:hypothetical protein